VNTPLTGVDLEECSRLGIFIPVSVQNEKEVSESKTPFG
jgi:hypothetical protein